MDCLCRRRLNVCETRFNVRIGSAIPSHCLSRAAMCREILESISRLSENGFPIYHNIATLLELCSRFSLWTHEIESAEELSSYAVSSRYPGEDEEVTRAQATRAIDIAESVRKVVRSGLSQEGFNVT